MGMENTLWMPEVRKLGNVVEEFVLGKTIRKSDDSFYGEIAGKIVEYVDWSDRLTFLINRVKVSQPKATLECPETEFSRRVVSEVKNILLGDAFVGLLRDWKLKSVSFYTAVGSPLDKLGADAFIEIVREPKDDRKPIRKDIITIDITTNPDKLSKEQVRADVIVRFRVDGSNIDKKIIDESINDSVPFIGQAIVEKFEELSLQQNSFKTRGKKMFFVDSGNLTRGVEISDRRETGKLDMWESHPGSGSSGRISSTRF
jgi:hypothetical protein